MQNLSRQHVENESELSGVPNISALVSNEGIAFKEFRKTLVINQSAVIYNMALPWLFIAVILLLFFALKESFWWSVFIIPPSTLWIAFWLQSYTSHFHEAAHFNIHPNKKMNDLLSDIFLTPFIGLRVKDYRISHWKHHRFLGLQLDTEISYHKPVTLGQATEGLTGIYLIKTVWRYFQNFRNASLGNAKAKRATSSFIWPLGFMFLIQAMATIALYYWVSLYAAITWIVSFILVGPFIAKIRQTLEHRSLTAKKDTDFSQVEHGPVNRVFGTDIISRNFGGAGFNRHLLHHFDPSVSYTCFDKLENFLMTTPAKDLIEANRTTYLKTFLALVKQ